VINNINLKRSKKRMRRKVKEVPTRPGTQIRREKVLNPLYIT